MNRRSFLAAATSPVWALAADNLSGQVVKDNAEGRTLKAIGEACGIMIGAQVEKIPLQYSPFATVVRNNFDIITPGNELKWPRLRPSPETFDFADADWMMVFAKNNGQKVHGHNLCWNSPSANPKWFDSVLSKSNARQFLTEHVTTVVKRYAGRIDSWDVVNEPFVPWNSRLDGLYPGVWVNLLGSEYIEIAFQAAAAADSSSLRVLNLNHVEYENPDDAKTQRIALGFIKQFLKRGVPIQAIGLESHLDASQPMGGASLLRFCDEIRQLGLQILITEMDVNDTHVEGNIEIRDTVVAKYYHDYLSEVVPALGVKRVIFWTPSDKWVWLNSVHSADYVRSDRMPHRAGLLDDKMQPKLAYQAVASSLSKFCNHN